MKKWQHQWLAYRHRQISAAAEGGNGVAKGGLWKKIELGASGWRACGLGRKS